MLRFFATLLLSLVPFQSPAQPEVRSGSSTGVAPKASSAAARFGLYIGIDSYPRIENGDLAGCANDARALRELFQTRFGFDEGILLVDEQATRQGIAAGFDRLLERVREAKGTGAKEVTALICYAGHGSRVLDQEGSAGDEKDDGRDETWVAHDSSWDGENDIRDDELEALLVELLALGADVLMVSDSCHSGSVHRGEPFARTRSLPRPEGASGERHGPSTPLRPKRVRGGSSLWDAPGFVSFSACADHQKASEHVDAAGVACGRFSLALRRVLETLPPDASYAGVFERVVAEFDREWGQASQTPQFHASAAMQGEIFLVGGYAPDHARVLSVDQRRGEVRLNQGLLQGVVEDALFEFHEDLTRLGAKRTPLGVGRVVEVDIASCVVAIEPTLLLPPGAVARLDRIRVREFRVRPANGLPKRLLARLQELARDGQIGLAGPLDPFDVAVGYEPSEHRLHWYDPAPAVRGIDGRSVPFRSVDAGSLEDAERVLVDELGQLARVARLLSLSRDDGSVRMQVLLRGGVEGPADPERVDGIPRVHEGDRLTLRFVNESRRRLFVHVLAVESSAETGEGPGSVSLVYPSPGSEPQAVGAFEELELARFRATAQTGLERTRLKLIAASEPLNLYPLLSRSPSNTRGESATGGDSVLRDLIGSTLGGTRLHRGIVVDAASVFWTTTDLVFDVVDERR